MSKITLSKSLCGDSRAAWCFGGEHFKFRFCIVQLVQAFLGWVLSASPSSRPHLSQVDLFRLGDFISTPPICRGAGVKDAVSYKI